ncbi:MAG: transketolase C-terminal domain-containing protein, partial [Bacteroidaceae bacterium]|nr:transketolase C-terminal domain-containing protein [Bacteroidaceae bacterium]
FEEIVVGSGRKLKDGEDLAVLSLGPIGNKVEKAITEAERRVAEQGKKLSIAHYDMRFVKPLDKNLLEKIGHKFKRIITIEDGVREGGFGSAVLEYFSDKDFHVNVTRMGLPDEFVEHGPVEELYKIVGLDQESIIKCML